MANNKDILLAFGLELQRQIIQNHIAAGQKATGDTINRIETEASETRLIIYGPPWVENLEKGTPPGNAPSESAIERWIRAKGLKINSGNVGQVAAAISQKIGKLGSELYRKGGRKDIFSNVLTKEKIDSLAGEMQFRFANLIKEEVLTEFKR